MTTLRNTSIGLFEELRIGPLRSDVAPQRMVIVIPGNPGLTGFYAGLAEVLAADNVAEVVVLGLAGHVAWAQLSAAMCEDT